MRSTTVRRLPPHRAAVPLAASLVALVAGGAVAAPASTPRTRDVAARLEVPWGIARLPSGTALVTERDTARILRVRPGGGAARPVMTVPGVAHDTVEGGLLGLAVSPRYRHDRLVYAFLTSATDDRVVRFRLGEPDSVEPVLTGIRKARFHNGGQIAFGPDGRLYVGAGDSTRGSLAQDPASLNGKILRVDVRGRGAALPGAGDVGRVPASNPFPASPVWSLGHRNVQGLAFDRAGRLWATELGEDATDEVNLIRRGRNYGWPEVEGRGDTAGGRFTNPQVTWPVAEASPSGVAVVGGSLYVGALRGQRLWRVPLHGARAGRPQALLTGRFGRVRGVAAGGRGRVLFATSNTDGRIPPRAGDDRLVALRPRR